VPAQRGDDVVQPGQFCLGMVVDGAKPYDLGLSLRLDRMQDGNFRLLLLVGGTQRASSSSCDCNCAMVATSMARRAFGSDGRSASSSIAEQ
jgi:hypothetical protein